MGGLRDLEGAHMASRQSDTVHVLQRLNWVHCRDDAAVAGLLFRLPGVVRLRSFDRAEEAEAEFARLEEAARRAVNPFLCGGGSLHFQTSYPEQVLYDWFADADISPPDATRDGWDWIAWWPKVKDKLTEAQWRHVWKALDRLNFYEVIAKPRRPVVYVIGQIGWRYNDQGFDPAPEGSKPLRAYRSRERAEAECKDENEFAPEAMDLDENGQNPQQEEYDIGERTHRANPFDDSATAELVFYEVVEVELEEGS
jgi:hypothetical protein